MLACKDVLKSSSLSSDPSSPAVSFAECTFLWRAWIQSANSAGVIQIAYACNYFSDKAPELCTCIVTTQSPVHAG